jgi:hypothetical protein
MRIPFRTSCQRDNFVFIHKEINSQQSRKARKEMLYLRTV